jgi:hypothetical protein
MDKETKQTHYSTRLLGFICYASGCQPFQERGLLCTGPHIIILLSLSVARKNMTEHYYEFGNTSRLISFSLMAEVSTRICKIVNMHVIDIIYSVC